MPIVGTVTGEEDKVMRVLDVRKGRRHDEMNDDSGGSIEMRHVHMQSGVAIATILNRSTIPSALHASRDALVW